MHFIDTAVSLAVLPEQVAHVTPLMTQVLDEVWTNVVSIAAQVLSRTSQVSAAAGSIV